MARFTHDLRKKTPGASPGNEGEPEETVEKDTATGRELTARRGSRKPNRREKPSESISSSADRPKSRSRGQQLQRQTRRTDEPRREIHSRRSGPFIGIPSSFEHTPRDPNHTQRYFYLNQPYVSAIFEAGGVPIIIPVGLEGRYASRVLGILDGLLLAGGADIDPNAYGDQPHEKLGRVDPRKDRTEIDLFNLAFNENMPILGICRGLQIINVALDGTLYQDIPSQVRLSLNHNPDFPRSEPSHRVEIEPGTKLHKIVGETTIWVNSTHHQAVKLHGKGLVVNAKASDGVTEGLEHPTKKWVLGVQWHPELYWRNDRQMAKLFKEFVEACK